MDISLAYSIMDRAQKYLISRRGELKEDFEQLLAPAMRSLMGNQLHLQQFMGMAVPTTESRACFWFDDWMRIARVMLQQVLFN